MPLLSNIVLKVLTRGIRQEKEIKTIQTEKEEVKLSLFASNMILYTGKTKYSIEILLGKLAGYKITKEKSMALVYTNNSNAEKRTVQYGTLENNREDTEIHWDKPN